MANKGLPEVEFYMHKWPFRGETIREAKFILRDHQLNKTEELLLTTGIADVGDVLVAMIRKLEEQFPEKKGVLMEHVIRTMNQRYVDVSADECRVESNQIHIKS